MQLSADDFVKIIVTVIASVGGVGAVLLGLVYWIGRLLADQIYQRTEAKFEKELEEIKSRHNNEIELLRAEVAERREMITAAQNAMSSGYMRSHERVLAAMEFLWNRVIMIRDWATPATRYYLLPEFNEWAKTHAAQPLEMPTIPDEYYRTGYGKLISEMEGQRPFVGEKLWELFSIYLAFASALVRKVLVGQQQGKTIAWNLEVDGKPDLISVLLLKIFGSEKLISITHGDEAAAPVHIMEALESEILSEMNQWLFGRRLTEFTIEERQRIADLLRPHGDITSAKIITDKAD